MTAVGAKRRLRAILAEVYTRKAPNACIHEQNVTEKNVTTDMANILGGGPLQREESTEQALRAALDAGLTEIGNQLTDFSGLAAFSSGVPDLDLDPLGVDFDVGHLQETDYAPNPSTSIAGAVMGPQEGSIASVSLSAGLTAGTVGGDLGGTLMAAAAVTTLSGGGEMSRIPSFGITGHPAMPTIVANGMTPGKAIPRQSSLDINTILQVCPLRCPSSAKVLGCTRRIMCTRGTQLCSALLDRYDMMTSVIAACARLSSIVGGARFSRRC